MKEFYIILGTFLFLTLVMHYKEWLSHPLQHINNLPDAGAYGLGIFHPLIFTLVIYILLWLPRLISKLINNNL
mgnify:CR=1 FL=1